MNVHTLNDLMKDNNNERPQQQNRQQQNGNSNIHTLNVINPSQEGQENQNWLHSIFNPAIFNLKTTTFVMIMLLLKVYLSYLFLFYIWYSSKGDPWICLLYNGGALQVGKIVNEYKIWNLITAIFLHNNFLHIFSNILSLVFISFYTEYLINNRFKFLGLFFATGIYGNLTSLLFNGNNISVGVSGVILGLCGYLIIDFIIKFKKMNDFEKKCMGIFIFLLILNIFLGIFVMSNVEIFSHLGGLFTGIVFGIIFLLNNPRPWIELASETSLKVIWYICLVITIIYPIGVLGYVFTGDYPNIKSSVCPKNRINKLI